MIFNPGPIISSTTAAITHSKRINSNNESKESETSNYIERTPTDYKQVSSPKEILEELKKVLEQEICKDVDSISLYRVINLVRSKYEECQSLDRRLCWKIADLIGENSLFLDIDYDCETKELIINRYGLKTYFKYIDGDFGIIKSSDYKATDILGKCGDKISERYDRFIEDISFYRDYMDNIKSTNSSFRISSDEYDIYITNNLNNVSEFKLSAKIYENKYDYDCNSNNIISICRNNEEEVLKRIFIKIEDCPKWMRSKLYEIRKTQLIEEHKKEKKLELVRKIFPFIRK